MNKYEITILGLLNLKKLGEALKPLKREVKIRKRWKFRKRETSFQLSSLLPRLKLSKAYNYPLLRLYMKVSISKPLFCMKITSYSTFFVIEKWWRRMETRIQNKLPNKTVRESARSNFFYLGSVISRQETKLLVLLDILNERFVNYGYSKSINFYHNEDEKG